MGCCKFFEGGWGRPLPLARLWGTTGIAPKLVLPVVETTKQLIEQKFWLVYFQHVIENNKIIFKVLLNIHIDQLCVYSLNIVDRLKDQSLTVGGFIDHMRNLLFSGEDADVVLLFDKAKPEPHCTKTSLKNPWIGCKWKPLKQPE